MATPTPKPILLPEPEPAHAANAAGHRHGRRARRGVAGVRSVSAAASHQRILLLGALLHVFAALLASTCAACGLRTSLVCCVSLSRDAMVHPSPCLAYTVAAGKGLRNVSPSMHRAGVCLHGAQSVCNMNPAGSQLRSGRTASESTVVIEGSMHRTHRATSVGLTVPSAACSQELFVANRHCGDGSSLTVQVMRAQMHKC